ncbi:MAG: phage GP46 family protein [Sphingobium sp.]
MTDIALLFDTQAWSADIAIAGGDLATDDGLRTAVVISLFTDARARDDDPLPDAGADRRGWWGDCANADPNDRIGSRLWLLASAKVTQDTAIRARDYCREALAWMVTDGIAAAVDVDCTLLPVDAGRRSGGLAIRIAITRPGGARQAIDFLWDAESARFDREGVAA